MVVANACTRALLAALADPGEEVRTVPRGIKTGALVVSVVKPAETSETAGV